MSRFARVVWFVPLVGLLTLGVMPAGAEPAFGHSAMQRVWQRYDKPVEDGVIRRSWTWGPNTYLTTEEEYADAPGGKRRVQYFDKSRMEINDPGVGQVTNGLLATEMITGDLQLGDTRFERRWNANIPVAGDADDPTSPRYASFRATLDDPALEVGATVNQSIDWLGRVSAFPRAATYNVQAAYHVPETRHTVAGPFWDYLRSRGPVYNDGQVQEGELFHPIFFVTGFPITEAYWTRVRVGGAQKDVLAQCFQRRCLTYTPDNEPEWQVEMGNIGQHYHRWRYQTHQGATLYRDDFSDRASGWPIFTAGNVQANYAVDKNDASLTRYLLNVLAPNRLTAVPHATGPSLRDTRVEVDAWQDGANRVVYGLVCRMQENNDGYLFLVDTTGTYGIVKVRDGLVSNIAEGSGSPAVRTETAINQIRADCVGDRLALYVNGQRVLEGQDGDFAEGRVGLAAASRQQAPASAYFDNYHVARP